jgi:DNA mismatch endonuclease (patch repair protein)
MVDVFDIEKRSAVMAAIRSRGNRDTELKLASVLRDFQIKGWRRHQALPGRPDFVFRRERLVIFVDGCFWHGCPRHGRKPDSNRDYWLPKLQRNQTRDRIVARSLRRNGWTVLRLWEHDLKNPARIAARCRRALTRAEERRACEMTAFAVTSSDS